MVTANYVFAALAQVAAEVTKTYLHAREQHLQRGTRAQARLFHALISDNFDSELELQKQALALNMPIVATGYVAAVCKLIIANHPMGFSRSGIPAHLERKLHVIPGEREPNPDRATHSKRVDRRAR